MRGWGSGPPSPAGNPAGGATAPAPSALRPCGHAALRPGRSATHGMQENRRMAPPLRTDSPLTGAVPVPTDSPLPGATWRPLSPADADALELSLIHI